MSWRKLNFHYQPKTYKRFAAVPFVKQFDNYFRVFFNNRDYENKSFIQSIDIVINNGGVEVIREEETVLFASGNKGFFDDSGVMGCDIINIQGKDLLYFIGWNSSVAVPFRNAIGVAEYNGHKFNRIFRGPIMDRGIYDPCLVASNCIVKIDNTYVMYYLSCDKWVVINNKPSHNYNIKIAYSDDGINWKRNGEIAIDYMYSNEYAISVPRVFLEDNVYKMFYSYRGGPKSESYKIGYAESLTGLDWLRKDDLFKSDFGNSEWDREMQCYPFVFQYKKDRYMLYNGNGYGETGFGMAKFER